MWRYNHCCAEDVSPFILCVRTDSAGDRRARRGGHGCVLDGPDAPPSMPHRRAFAHCCASASPCSRIGPSAGRSLAKAAGESWRSTSIGSLVCPCRVDGTCPSSRSCSRQGFWVECSPSDVRSGRRCSRLRCWARLVVPVGLHWTITPEGWLGRLGARRDMGDVHDRTSRVRSDGREGRRALAQQISARRVDLAHPRSQFATGDDRRGGWLSSACWAFT